MKKFKFTIREHRMLADTLTPVWVYMLLRDRYPFSLLLESSDYHGVENSQSFICLEPMAHFMVKDQNAVETLPGNPELRTPLTQPHTLTERLAAFLAAFEPEHSLEKPPPVGVFGYTCYDAVRYFEKIELKHTESNAYQIPEMHYALYRFVIRFNHFNDEIAVFEHIPDGETSRLDELLHQMKRVNFIAYPFQATGEVQSNLTDQEYRQLVEKGIEHCLRGDVFQVVFSRQFSRSFYGDDFNVYRALRHINPSPYLFYFDFGDFKLFGSSPEAQIKIKGSKVTINPIAGTYKRTHDEASDLKLAEMLAADSKENAEHVMLVDLARNDMYKACGNHKVKTFKEVQFYSHVLHLVSEVAGELKPERSRAEVMAATFPAGTLSGAPKYKAMQLIDRYENQNRGFYGGCIGFMGLNGDTNQAILIRSFLSKNNVLYCQAGAGIVKDSSPESELNEVNNKLAALNKALQLAETIK
jgi:anthranilate synthase component 1